MHKIALYIDSKDYAKLRSRLIIKGKSVSGWFREKVMEFLIKEYKKE